MNDDVMMYQNLSNFLQLISFFFYLIFSRRRYLLVWNIDAAQTEDWYGGTMVSINAVSLRLGRHDLSTLH